MFSLIVFFRTVWTQILGRYVLKLKARLSSKNYIPVASLRNVSVKAVFKFRLSIRQEAIYQIGKYEIIFDVSRVTEPRILWEFNKQTEVEQYLKLNKFLDIRRIYTSYVRLVIYCFKFREQFSLKVGGLKWVLADITIIVEIGPIIDILK